MNSECISAREALAAPLATIDVNYTWSIDCDVTDEDVEFDGFLYDINWTIAGSGTGSTSFIREDFKPDDPDGVTANAFAIETARDVVSEGKYVPFFRDSYARLRPRDDPYTGISFENTAVDTYSVTWARTFTPTDGGPPIASEGDTETGATGVSLLLSQDADQVEWLVDLYFINLFTSPAFENPPGTYAFDGETPGGSFSIGPWSVTVHDLKKSGAVDIGGVSTIAYTDPTNWDIVTLWERDHEITVVCS